MFIHTNANNSRRISNKELQMKTNVKTIKSLSDVVSQTWKQKTSNKNTAFIILFLVIGIALASISVQLTFAVTDDNSNTGNEDPEFCEPGQVEGPFDNCTDPVCEPGQVLGNDHTCTNPTCPPGMEYNEEVGECLSSDLPTDTTCPDGSKGTIRNGPNGITLIECPQPYPDSNPPPKPGLDRGNINIKGGVLEDSNSNPPPKPGLDRGNINNNIGVIKE
ncbi:MAG: hypothetical protein P0116_13850 [Candidatus Nitrosocosmicus sp.]|nr:hypothetical protein [Candidatus Nitrosocosmicus sp.]